MNQFTRERKTSRVQQNERFHVIYLLVVGLLAVFGIPTYAQELPGVETVNPVDSQLPTIGEMNALEGVLNFEILDAPLPGTIKGTGTFFEVTDSKYLNVTVQSSEPIQLRLESIPSMVIMQIASAGEATSSSITITGLLPLTPYFKYENDYRNKETFTTDENGSHTYTQDLSEPSVVFIQPKPSTKYIPTDTQIGIWDSVNRIYTLTQDVFESIQIVADNFTLDGAGHTVTGSNSGIGIYFTSYSNITIKNITIQNFSVGIYISGSSNTQIINNIVKLNTSSGIDLSGMVKSKLSGNIVSNNGGDGIHMESSPASTSNPTNKSIVENNIASENGASGIYLTFCPYAELTGNIASKNQGNGILSGQYGDKSILMGNVASDNKYGISILSN